MFLPMQFIWVVITCGGLIVADDPFPPITTDIDVFHYEFGIIVTDDSDSITGEAFINFKYTRNDVKYILFDLVSPGTHDFSPANPHIIDPEKTPYYPKNLSNIITGMEVARVQCDDYVPSYTHTNDVLRIPTSGTVVAGQNSTCIIFYRGVPADGLIIGTTKWGDRTFFGDNWPNRAHHWLPCIDHPSVKATVEWSVEYPDHYEIIANGRRDFSRQLEGRKRTTQFTTLAPIPTKVMVIGIASFASEAVGHTDQGVEVSSWIFPQVREEGFYDYALGLPILNYLTDLFGPFSYFSLANVQSKTRYGGMENAGCIFYSESSVTGTRSSESLLVHEIVHQFFGDSATELEWLHIWLSEGFATYFTHYYIEAHYGTERFIDGMKSDRQSIFNYEKTHPGSPLVDPAATSLNSLLNTNSYQKGGWVLHMLRYLMGDVPFITGVRTYYRKFQNSNALSKDLQKEMEVASGIYLQVFFNQWVYGPGHMELKAEWSYVPESNTLYVRITQLQNPTVFVMPLELKVCISQDNCKNFTVDILTAQETFVLLYQDGIPSSIELDPQTWLLMEAEIVKSSNMSVTGNEKIVEHGNLVSV